MQQVVVVVVGGGGSGGGIVHVIHVRVAVRRCLCVCCCLGVFIYPCDSLAAGIQYGSNRSLGMFYGGRIRSRNFSTWTRVLNGMLRNEYVSYFILFNLRREMWILVQIAGFDCVLYFRFDYNFSAKPNYKSFDE